MPASTFNNLLRDRQRIKHKRVDRRQLVTAPVCLHRFNDLKRKLHRVKRDCRYKANAVKCWIVAAARAYHQPVADALRVAYCESSYIPRNSYLGHYGLFQFLWSTWKTTPFGRRDTARLEPSSMIWSPRWNSLAAMWMWAHGRRNEWACQ